MTATVAEYVLLWALYCLLAGAILARDRKTLLPEWRDYFRFLTVPWKICVFVPAFLFVSFAGHFTNDETWDFVTGSGMSILTFLTAPWAIGLFCQVFAGKRPRRYLIVASALCFFSSSWFYDSYLLWRDGVYTQRWLGNLMASTVIYVAAGLLWNLEAEAGGRYTLSFNRQDWPSPPVNTRFRPLILISLPLILIAAYVLVASVRWRL
ncbi:membrane hypothetical protein [Verrucomicrobia bacterium]|nr:membrane hypothetical protein [Verrucomicrobiota bacterium]